MKLKKQRSATFIAVLPAVLLASCAQSTFKTNNPPEPEPATLMTNPPEPEPATSPTTPPEPEPATLMTNPPEPSQDPPTTESATPKPDLWKPPPPSYGPRYKKASGECYVEVAANPPFRIEVSCKAPIEPAAEGEKWCKVATAKDPGKKTGVRCDSK